MVKDGVLMTPPAAASILQGITRDSVMKLARGLGYEAREQVLPREALYVADEVFMTGTAAEITPIRELDNRQIGEGKRGPITTRLQSLFFDCANGRVPAHEDWLSYV